MGLCLECLEVRENPSVAFTPRVPAELWQALAADVRVLVEGTTKPSEASVQALVTTTQAALADGEITKVEAIKIAQAANVVLAEANIPPEEIAAVVSDARAIYVAWGANG